MDINDWLESASRDAKARGLDTLEPLLQALARSTRALRDADTAFGHPAVTPRLAAKDGDRT